MVSLAYPGSREHGRESSPTLPLDWHNELVAVTRPRTPLQYTINEAVRQFDRHEVASPAVMLGATTDFGPSSIAIGQFLWASGEVQHKLQSGEWSEATLREQDRALLALRQAYDRSEVARLMEQNPQDAAIPEAFQQFLQSEGIDTIVAMKSPEDVGRRGELQLWNRIDEMWDPPVRFIVLNSATPQTWNQQLRFLESDFRDQVNDQGEPITVRWIVEVADEAKVYQPEENLRLFARLWMQEVGERYTVRFPETFPAQVALQPAFQAVAQALAQKWQQPETAQQLRNIMASLTEQGVPTEFVYHDDTQEYSVGLTSGRFVAFVLQQLEVPLYRDETDDIVTSMLDPQFPPSLAGFPIGSYSQQQATHIFAQNGEWQTYIIGNRRRDEVGRLQAGLYAVETFPPATEAPQTLEWGVVFRDAGQLFFATLLDNQQLQIMTQPQLESRVAGLRERLVIFSSARAPSQPPSSAASQR